MSKYPQADIVDENREQSQAIGEFLDWLNEQGIMLCRRHGAMYEDLEGNRISEDEAYTLGFENYRYEPEVLLPQRESIEDLLARFFGVDLEAYEAEKRQMLRELKGS